MMDQKDTGMTAGADRLLQRPIYGGAFGQGRYMLATVPYVSHGLHAIRYMVLDPRAGAVLSVAGEKAQALNGARRLIEAANDARFMEERPAGAQGQLWLAEDLEPTPAELPLSAAVSRRRREIFEGSAGRCHYCGVALQLAGAWHVEHMMPRALGGGDDSLNLVAACVPCNLAKSDRTAIEFVVSGAVSR